MFSLYTIHILTNIYVILGGIVMKKMIDYAIGVTLTLFTYLLWFLVALRSPLSCFIPIAGLILFLVCYSIYLKHTHFIHLSGMLLIPLMLFLVTTKDNFITASSPLVLLASLLGFISLLTMCALALYKYVKQAQRGCCNS